jgi:acyl-CoA synthetase (AMP-forming)/AMP-acid ligase II
MHLSSLLDIVADALGDRVAVAACAGGELTYKELSERADAVSRHLTSVGAERLVAVDVNSEAVPVGLFGAARAAIPYVPVNYRLADAQLRAILERAAPGLAVVEPSVPPRLGGDIPGLSLISRDEFLVADGPAPPSRAERDPEDPAVLLFTSGTTGEPKAAVLRHRHLTSYVLETVEFMGADPEDAALVSVPPYHIAGIAAVLSSVWSGRRLVYLPQFSAETWVDLAAAEAVTHAMVVPTMLGRILEVLVERDEQLPALRHLSYGGGRMPLTLVERALEQLPHVGLVNAYGLTETSSTIAVLGPEDHREAIGSTEPAVRGRLGSVGRPLPNLQVEIRDPYGAPLEAGSHGEIWVKGDQVSGEYLGRAAAVSADGWLATHDGGWLDQAGYLFVEGRLDDVIVRGGENLSPGEIEEVLLLHPAVADAAVFGVPDEEWGETVAAVIVLVESGAADEASAADADSLRVWVAERLRSTRAPEHIEFRTELPYSETGKLLRRVLKAELGAGPTS